MIWTINRIIQNFRTTRGIKFSSDTIRHFAEAAGYKLKHSGGLIGYDKSVYTVLTQRFNDLVRYEQAKGKKTPQKPLKREIEYNPDQFIEPEDRVDYEWEKNENKNMNAKNIFEINNRKQLVGLWLDDSRKDPVGFLGKDDNSGSATVVRNWYRGNMSDVDIQWTAVSNYWQFKDYILKNGVPDFVSLDHDLGKDPRTGALRDSGEHAPTGTDCAMFLISYCLRKHIPLPKHYIHSANDNQRVFISKVFRLGKMGKDPLEGVDLNDDQGIGQAAENFKNGIVGTKEMKKKGQLGTADRLARMRGLKDTNKLFKDKKDIYRENKNSIKQLIRLTESDLHRIIKESVKRILKEKI